MKVGFSLGRCVRDIIDDIVTYDDVAFIITGTALRYEDAIKACVEQYMYRVRLYPLLSIRVGFYRR